MSLRIAPIMLTLTGHLVRYNASSVAACNDLGQHILGP